MTFWKRQTVEMENRSVVAWDTGRGVDKKQQHEEFCGGLSDGTVLYLNCDGDYRNLYPCNYSHTHTYDPSSIPHQPMMVMLAPFSSHLPKVCFQWTPCSKGSMKTSKHSHCSQGPPSKASQELVFLCWPKMWRYLQPLVLPPAPPSTQPSGKSASTEMLHWEMPLLSPWAAGETTFCTKEKKRYAPFSASHFHRDITKCSQLRNIFVEIAHSFLFPLIAEPLPPVFFFFFILLCPKTLGWDEWETPNCNSDSDLPPTPETSSSFRITGVPGNRGSPKGMHTLITGTSEWVMLHGKNGLAGIIKVMGLKHGGHLN